MSTKACLRLLPLLFAMSNAACHCDLVVNGKCRDTRRESDPPLTAKWQVFDAESEKPIEGAWISFLWYGKADKRGVTTCVGSAIGRTNKDGVFQDTAADGSWRMDTPAMIYVPGYEQLQYHPRRPDAEHVTAFVEIPPSARTAYTAWFQRLESLGYKYVDEGGTTTYYEKVLPNRIGIPAIFNKAVEDGGRKEFWVTTRSLPEYANRDAVGASCGKPGARDVGFDDPAVAMIDKQRGLGAFRYICDPQWDSVPSDYTQTDSYLFVSKALWLLPDLVTAQKDVMGVLPQYMADVGIRSSNIRALTKEERQTFCAWIEPHARTVVESLSERK